MEAAAAAAAAEDDDEDDGMAEFVLAEGDEMRPTRLVDEELDCSCGCCCC